MLTIKQIRDDKEAAARKLAKKGVDAAPVIEKIISFDDRRKALQLELDNTLAAQNKAAKEIGALMGQGRREEAEERKRFVADLKEKSSRLQAELCDAQQELQDFSRELADVQMYVDVQVNFDGLTRFVDMFCDSFFVDWMVQDQIVRAQENVAEARSRVWEAVQQLRFLIGA